MSKTFEWGERISSDNDTIDAYLHSGELAPGKVSESDLWSAMEWLAMYQAESPDEEIAQALANVIGMLQGKAEQMAGRKAMAAAKRAYAAEHGIPVSQVRVVRS